MKLHPRAFEFTDSFLVLLYDHSNLCLFGTFLCDSEKQRDDLGLTQKTSDFWQYVKILEKIHPLIFLNPYYQSTPERLALTGSGAEVTFWSGMYDRFLQQTPQTKATTAHIRSLYESALVLTRRLEVLKLESAKERGQPLQEQNPPRHQKVRANPHSHWVLKPPVNLLLPIS